jgi:hypothetical protein
LAPVFNQYLRDVRIPTLEYYFLKGYIYYRWTNARPEFRLSVPVTLGNETLQLAGTTEWTRYPGMVKEAALQIDPDYYVGEMKIMAIE